MVEIPLRAKYLTGGQFKACPYAARTGNRSGPGDKKNRRRKRWSYQPPFRRQQKTGK